LKHYGYLCFVSSAPFTAIENILPVLSPFLSPCKGLLTGLANFFFFHADFVETIISFCTQKKALNKEGFK
jgi:predicted membrane protein